jgi:Flp pilus assembly protein TadG
MAGLVNKLSAVLPRLAAGTQGNVSLLFALAVVPVILASGAAVDYVRNSRAQTQLQAAADGAALAVADSGATDNNQQKQIGYNYFSSNLADAALKNVKPNIQISGTRVIVSAQFDYPTSFMALAGIDTMKISGYSQVEQATDSNTEIALVLDYSHSMVTNNKYGRMRDAASKMIDSLAKSRKTATLKIGLVPFSALIRTSMPAGYVTQSSATETWTGCTQDRKYPLNTGVTTPDVADDGTKWGYIENSYENQVPYDCSSYANNKLDIVPLSDDLDAVKGKLADMYPVGNTDIPLGVEFGWNLLDPDAPFTEGAPYDDDTTKKFMVLLTDGVQTSKEFGPSGSRNVAAGNDNLVTLCDNIKTKNITIFAIAYDITNPVVTKLLKQCAGDNYFEASTGGTEIDQVFKSITARIKRKTMHLAR